MISANIKIIILFLLLSSGLRCSVNAFNWKDLHQTEYELQPEERTGIQIGETIGSAYVAGLNYLTLRYDDKAREAFEYILNSSTSNIAARWGLAEIARRQYRMDESKSILDDIIATDPGFMPAKITRAYIYMSESYFKEAISTAREVLNAGEESVDTANIIRANLIIGGSKGLIAEKSFIFRKVAIGLGALKYLKAARAINPEDAGVLFAWGSYYLIAPGIAGGDIDKSEEFLLKALRKDPRFADIHARLAHLYLKTGDMDQYKYYLQRAMRLDPRNALAEEIMGLLP